MNPVTASTGIEGYARVVAVEGATLWLEPEQGTSCGHCPSAASCAPGIGSLGSRLAARRFAVPAVSGIGLGERVVVAVAATALLRAALLAYALPLFVALLCGSAASAADAGDAATLAATLGGLGLGLLLVRFGAGRLAARGQLAPRLLRRAGPDSCQPGVAP